MKQSYRDRLTDISAFTEESEIQDEYAILDRAGRLQIPREMLEKMQIRDNKVRIELVDGRIIIENPEIEHIQKG